MALGGSTNAVLHLLAIAHEARVDLTLDDFNRIGDRTPHLADVKPFGRYVMTDIDGIGGIPVVMKALLDAGLLHGDALTVTGKTVAENLAHIAPPDPDGKIIHALSEPIHKTGGLAILRGIARARGRRREDGRLRRARFDGTARVFDGERAAMDAVVEGTLKAGDVVVIRYEGPKGGPGMREMLAVTGAIKGAGLGKDVLLLTDGRFSGGTTGAVHRPRRARGHQRRSDRASFRTATGSTSTSPPEAPRPARRRRGARAPPGRLEAARAALHHRRTGQVRQAGRLGRRRRHLRLTPLG